LAKGLFLWKRCIRRTLRPDIFRICRMTRYFPSRVGRKWLSLGPINNYWSNGRRDPHSARHIPGL